jgi:hypothetical protein
MNVRSFAPEDYMAARQLWESVEGMGLNESDTEPAVHMFLARNPGFSAVAWEGNVLVGAVLCGHKLLPCCLAGRRVESCEGVAAPAHSGNFRRRRRSAVSPLYAFHGLLHQRVSHGTVSAGQVQLGCLRLQLLESSPKTQNGRREATVQMR